MFKLIQESIKTTGEKHELNPNKLLDVPMIGKDREYRYVYASEPKSSSSKALIKDETEIEKSEVIGGRDTGDDEFVAVPGPYFFKCNVAHYKDGKQVGFMKFFAYVVPYLDGDKKIQEFVICQKKQYVCQNNSTKITTSLETHYYPLIDFKFKNMTSKMTSFNLSKNDDFDTVFTNPNVAEANTLCIEYPVCMTHRTMMSINSFKSKEKVGENDFAIASKIAGSVTYAENVEEKKLIDPSVSYDWEKVIASLRGSFLKNKKVTYKPANQ